jgi:hypothetical protein
VLDRVGLVTSVLVHLLLVLWVVGSLASAEKLSQDEVIPVVLVPAETTPSPSPPEAAPRDVQESALPKSQQSPAPPSPAKVPAGISPADVPAAGEDQTAPWSSVLASLGMATYSHPATLSKEELDALSAQARRCWNIPAGWTDPRQISVTVRFRLNRDGSLNGTPAVVQFPASELGKAAAIAAVRAVLQCGPFDLPSAKYDEWNDVQLRFEP